MQSPNSGLIFPIKTVCEHFLSRKTECKYEADPTVLAQNPLKFNGSFVWEKTASLDQR